MDLKILFKYFSKDWNFGSCDKKNKEIQMEIVPTKANRAELSKSNADLKRFMKIKEEFLKQKAGMRWFNDGDKNTKFIHAYVNGIMKKLNITKIKTRQGDIITSSQNTGEKTANFSMLQCIPKIITDYQNCVLDRAPTKD